MSLSRCLIGPTGNLLDIHDLDNHFDTGVMLTKFHTPAPDVRADRIDRSRGHGQIDLTDYYDSRIVELEGIVKGSDFDDLADKVDALGQAFAMDGVAKFLRFKRLGRTDWEELIVTPGSALDMPIEVPTLVLPWSISLVAGDPRIYTNPVKTLSFASSGVATNNGSFNTPPVIRIYGAGTNGGVENTELSTQNTIQLATVLIGGDIVEIDMAARTVTLNGTPNRGILDPASYFWKLGVGASTLSKVGGADHIEVDYRDARIL